MIAAPTNLLYYGFVLQQYILFMMSDVLFGVTALFGFFFFRLDDNLHFWND